MANHQDHPDPLDEAAVSSMTTLRASLNDLAESFSRKTSEIHEDIGTVSEFITLGEKLREEAGRRQNRILVVLAALLVLSLFGNVATLQVASSAKATSEAVADCTTAHGKCYEAGRARTGDAISDLIVSQLAVVQCARLYPGESGPAYDAKLAACVRERVLAAQKAREAQPSPSPSAVPSGG